MANNKQPIARRCRALDITPAVMGYANKKSKRNPGGNRRKKVSEYGNQLKEKQKVKFIYGVLEKQFRHYLVYRLGLAKTRRMARQIVGHGHIRVNGKKVDIPSYQVKKGDVITLRERSASIEMFKALREGTTVLTPKWLTFNAAELTGTVNELPTRADIDFEVQENMIVEFYSR